MTSVGRVRAPDRNRAKVYAAEDQFSSLMNRGGKVEFFSSVLANSFVTNNLPNSIPPF